MIATRFRTVVWAALVALAALGCYLVSLQVAAERAQLARLDGALSAGRHDIRDLGTELDTRGRLVQLERWNSDTLALMAPKAAQYLSGQVQLASMASPAPAQASADPAVAALEPTPTVARAAYHPAGDQPATKLVHSVSLALDDGHKPAALLHRAALTVGSAPVLLDSAARP